MWEFLVVLTQTPKSDVPKPNNHEHDEEACVSNISPRERVKRLIGGVILFVFALVILAWLISTNADRLWRLPLFFLFVGAASGFFQWRDKT
jgi:predicted CDP-diglyceride synthetase/phosphatidate cytidylyltransferase